MDNCNSAVAILKWFGKSPSKEMVIYEVAKTGDDRRVNRRTYQINLDPSYSIYELDYVY